MIRLTIDVEEDIAQELSEYIDALDQDDDCEAASQLWDAMELSRNMLVVQVGVALKNRGVSS